MIPRQRTTTWLFILNVSYYNWRNYCNPIIRANPSESHHCSTCDNNQSSLERQLRGDNRTRRIPTVLQRHDLTSTIKSGSESRAQLQHEHPRRAGRTESPKRDIVPRRRPQQLPRLGVAP